MLSKVCGGIAGDIRFILQNYTGGVRSLRDGIRGEDEMQ